VPASGLHHCEGDFLANAATSPTGVVSYDIILQLISPCSILQWLYVVMALVGDLVESQLGRESLIESISPTRYGFWWRDAFLAAAIPAI
jgi:hypothetical protein